MPEKERITGFKTYLKISDFAKNPHPRRGGGPLKALRNMDSRLRGNDDRVMKRDFEIGSDILAQFFYFKEVACKLI